MKSLGNYIQESIRANNAKPLGFVGESEFKNNSYKDYWMCLLRAIAKNTPLKRNDNANGVWEEFRLDNNLNLKAIKITSVGKNSQTKPKKISERNVSNRLEDIAIILFGKDVKPSYYDNLDSLANYIVSTDYKNRSKETIKNIIKDFLDICERKSLTKKLYKIKPWLNSKVETII